MSDEEFWLPLVDEPLGDIIARIQATDTQITSLITSPRRQLAFRTFAYIRVGLLLGELLVDHDLGDADPSTWIDRILADPTQYARIVDEVRAVAHEVATDPKLAGEEPVGPDAGARERFRLFARDALGD